MVDLFDSSVNTGIAAGDSYYGIENLSGSNAGDRLRGDANGNYIWGYGGNDHLAGRNGNDKLIGRLGADSLAGGAGKDVLYGQDGSYAFVFKENFARDYFQDFQDNVTRSDCGSMASAISPKRANSPFRSATGSASTLGTMMFW